MNTQHPVFLAAFLLALAVGDSRAASDGAAGFKAEHAQWLKAREAELTQPDGWTSLIGLHWLEKPEQSLGGGEQEDIHLRIAPPHLGEIALRDGKVYFTAAKGAAVDVDGRPPQGEVELKPEGRDGGDHLRYDDGKGKITVIGRQGSLALRVRHADSPDRLNFKGLEAFAPDEQWQVKARFVPHPPGKTLKITNILGNVSESPNPGVVEFQRDGRTWTLEATGDPAKGLSFIFKDATSGKETYGVGRFLKTGPVAADGTVLIDFNRAYNPPCAFTEYATCPLPPPENRFTQQGEDGKPVRLAVLAGEKKYATAH